MPRVLLDASGAKSGKIHMNNDDGCNTNKKFASESFDKTIIKICQGTSPLHCTCTPLCPYWECLFYGVGFLMLHFDDARKFHGDFIWYFVCALVMIPVGITNNRVEMRRRIVAEHKNKANKEEKWEHNINEVRQFAYILRAGRERVLIKPINYRI